MVSNLLGAAQGAGIPPKETFRSVPSCVPCFCGVQDAHLKGAVVGEEPQTKELRKAFKAASHMKTECRTAVFTEYVLDQLFLKTPADPAGVGFSRMHVFDLNR